MEKKFSYRITKVAGRAVAVATAGVALTCSLLAHAGPVYLGTQYPGNVTVYDGSTIASIRYDDWGWGEDNWYDQSSSAANTAYSVSQSRAGDIFYGNTKNYVVNSSVFTNNNSTAYYDLGASTDVYYWADAQRDSYYLANEFG